jgi:hypothetical protein
MSTERWRPCAGYPTLQISHPTKLARLTANKRLLIRSVQIHNDKKGKITDVNIDKLYNSITPSPDDWVTIPNHKRYEMNGEREIRHAGTGEMRDPRIHTKAGGERSIPLEVLSLYRTTWAPNAPDTTLIEEFVGEIWRSSERFSMHQASHPGKFVRNLSQQVLGRFVSLAKDTGGVIQVDIDKLVRKIHPTGFQTIPEYPSYEINEFLEVRHKHHRNPHYMKVALSGIYYDIDHLYELAFTPLEERACYDAICDLAVQYPGRDTSVMYNVSPHDRGNLLCIKRPDLLPELVDQSKIFTLSFGTNSIEEWRCIDHKTLFSCAVGSSACRNRRPTCCHLTREQLSVIGRDALAVGEEAEHFAVGIFEKVLGVVSVLKIGHLSNPSHDLEITLKNGNVKAVQVKVLRQSYRCPNHFCISSVQGYDPRLIILAVNPDFPHLSFVCLAGELPSDVDTLGITFGTLARTYKPNKFVTERDLLMQLIFYLHTAIEAKDLNNIYSENNRKEKESVKRFEKRCIEHGSKYVSHDNNHDVTDGALDSHATQMKYSSKPHHYKYAFGISKHGPYGTRSPYAEEDGLKFFVFEIGDYQGQFLIIPIHEMIEHGYISTPSQDGKLSAYFPPPDYHDQSHWAIKYWNNFTQLTA